jgi:hypothetical protein
MTLFGGVVTDKNNCRLNGATHRYLTPLQKIIKASNHTLMPGVCQISFDLTTQGSEPVTLAIAANAREPFTFSNFGYDT